MSEIVMRRFFDKVSGDNRIKSTHMLLYMALLHSWMGKGHHNPFQISRAEIMSISKIQGLSTYHKHIRELNMFGYIIYQPSYHPHLASQVTILDTM